MSMQQQLLACFPPNEAITRYDLAAILPLPPLLLTRLLKRLIDAGQIERLGQGVYRQTFRDRVWSWDGNKGHF